MSPHSQRNAFSDQLDEIHAAVERLGAMVCAAIPEATRILLESDLEAARKLIEDDDVLDALTVHIEEQCLQILVLQNPVAGDLRAVVSTLRVATEIERCGDLANNIAKAARRIYTVELDPKMRGMITRMSGLALRQLRFALEAYATCDLGMAAALDDLDDELDGVHREFIESVFQMRLNSDTDLRVAVQLALVGRFYERLGDHAVNIGERVQYQATGWLPEYDGATRARIRSALPGDASTTGIESATIRGVVVAPQAEQRRVEALRRDFVANIGHELRTPVGALAVLAETLHSEVEKLEGVKDAQTVLRLSDRLTHEATRLGRTIDDLLELSRIEAGEKLERTDIALTQVLQGALDRTGSAAELRDVRVVPSISEPDAFVSGDRRQLVSALANLIDNAIKYSESGGRVEVDANVRSNGTMFEVRDFGIGIPESEQVRIFERFHRVDRARRRDTGGTGLGLAIVRHVAMNHGGTIGVSSTEGDGSTFSMWIPNNDGESANMEPRD